MGLPGLTKFQGDRLYGLPLARRRPAAPVLAPPSLATTLPTLTLAKASGATAASIAGGGTGYAVGDQITLTGGTFGVAAVLSVTSVSSGVITGIAIRRRGTYTATPANPVAQGSTTGAGTGATFTMTWGAGSASTLTDAVQLGNTSSTFRFTGNGPSAGGGNSVGNGTACTWEWCTDAPQMDIRCTGSNTIAMLFVDGVRVADTGFSTDTSGAAYVYTVDYAGVRRPRTYRLMMVNGSFTGLIVGPTDTVWTPNHQRRPLAWGLGDSYMFGTGTDQVFRSAFCTMCDLLGLEPMPDGIGGSGWTTASPTSPHERVAAKLATLTQPVDYVFVDLGYNDSAAIGSGSNLATLQAEIPVTIAAIRAAQPKAKIIFFGPATPVGGTTNLTTVKTAVQAACATAGIPFVDTENWVSSTNKSIYTSADNVHPGQVGHEYIGARKAQAVAQYL